ncbi:MAG: peptidylprolyl isomerase, partial [Pirellulales bacterium]|nr:peptidylprolyl isomerase [Pirellulales bacterium]
MNALSRLFETLHLSRMESSSHRSHRRRRSRRQVSSLSCETLEPKQLLAADVAVQFSDLVLDTTDPTTVAIEGKFDDDEVFGTVVKFETNAPLADNDFYVELTDNTPLTNANFLSYVNSGEYDNTIFHRSIKDFVIQGGGYTSPTVPANQWGSDPVNIVGKGFIQNEPGNLNERGTISMAKLGGQPDSATSQFFFNLSDNPHLDSTDGGFTQFGSVLGSGMTVVDVCNSAFTYEADAYYSGDTALVDLPLWNLNDDNIVLPEDFVKINNVDEVTESDLFTYQVTSSDAGMLTASVDGNGNLVLTPDSSANGSVDVTVIATSKLDTTSSAEQTFSVQLNGGGPVGPVLT